jgi:hypothetical protein
MCMINDVGHTSGSLEAGKERDPGRHDGRWVGLLLTSAIILDSDPQTTLAYQSHASTSPAGNARQARSSSRSQHGLART